MRQRQCADRIQARHAAPALSRRALLAGVAAIGTSARIPGIGPLGSRAIAAPMLLQKVPDAPAAPDFALPDLDGRTRTLKEFAGRIVIANFWATWCPPCRAEIPSMQRAWEKLEAEGAHVLALHVGGDPDQIWSFLAEFNVTFPILLDRSGTVSRAWQTVGLPTTYVVDVAGRKALRAIGERAWDDPTIISQILALKDAKP